MHVVAGAVGVSALVMASAEAFSLLKLAGAAYLIWLGIKTFRTAGQFAVLVDAETSGWRHAFREGVIVEALNPKTAASQFHGGIIMGLGLAPLEQTQFDERSGRIANPSLADRHVPVHSDVPEIDVAWTDIANSLYADRRARHRRDRHHRRRHSRRERELQYNG